MSMKMSNEHEHEKEHEQNFLNVIFVKINLVQCQIKEDMSYIFCKNKGLKIEVFDENENYENYDEKKKKKYF